MSGSALGSGSSPADQATIDKWDKANQETLIQIVLTLEHKVAALITGKSLASEAWTTVKNCFNGQGIQSVTYLMTKLWHSMMTLDHELLPQIQEVKDCVQKLKSLGYEISNELQAIAIILSLPLEYETLYQLVITTMATSRPKLKVLEKKCVNCHLLGHTIEKCWSEGGGAEGQRPKHWGKPKP